MLLLKRVSKSLKRQVSNGKYIPEVDGLRFIAILMVCIQHLSERLIKYTPLDLSQNYQDSFWAFWASRGTSGVLLFFTISGFILGLPLVKKAKEGSAFEGLQKYWMRRIKRIEPPYLIWMTFFALILIIRQELSIENGFYHWLASVLYLHNFWYEAYSPINPVAWSLEVEIQFYLLAPVLAWLYFTLVKKRMGLVLVLSILLAFILQKVIGADEMPWKASLVNTIQYFLLGYLLAHWYQLGYLKNKTNSRTKQYLWDAIGFVAQFGLYIFWSEEIFKEYFLVASITLIFFAAFRGYWLRWLLTRPSVVIIGGMCYTIYLIHLPLLELIVPITAQWAIGGAYGWRLLSQLIICLPIVFMVSAAGYLLIERPFMQGRHSTRLHLSIQLMQLNIMKNKILTKLLSAFLFLLLPLLVLGQQERTGSFIPSNLRLQPVDALVQAALEKAPVVAIQDYKIDNRLEEIKLIRRRWMDNIQFAGNYLMNNGLYLDAVETFNNNAYSLTSRRNMVYNVGVTFKVPIGAVTNKSLRIKQEENEIQIERLRKQELQSELRKLVKELYQDILLQQEVLAIRAEAFQTNKLALDLAETYFKQGAEPMETYTRAIQQKTRSEEELVQIKNRLQISLELLKELCGNKILID